MDVNAFIQRLKESESYKKFKAEMHEMSVTGMVAGYETPKAFAPQDSDGRESFDAKTKDNAEQFGYKIVSKKKRRNSISKEEYAKQESVRKSSKKLQESSTSNNAGSITIGDSFIDDEFEDNDEQRPHSSMRSVVHQAGYTPVHNGTKRSSAKQDSMYKQAMRALHEASYREYRSDKSKSTNEKINYSIKELNQALLRVERAVNHAVRLKTEMAVDQRLLWRSSHNRLVKIGERLNRIGKKINELGA